jgi:hypothetical protein
VTTSDASNHLTILIIIALVALLQHFLSLLTKLPTATIELPRREEEEDEEENEWKERSRWIPSTDDDDEEDAANFESAKTSARNKETHILPSTANSFHNFLITCSSALLSKIPLQLTSGFRKLVT